VAIQQKLHTKLVQKLILTPSLQQAIKLLPMSTLELADLLNQEMVENPLLEEVPTEELQPAEQQAQNEKADADKPSVEKTDQWDDADYEYFFGDYLDDGYRSRTPAEVKELPPIENTLSSAASLADHLMWQLSLQSETEKVKGIGDAKLREIGGAIIGNLDDDGYLVASVEEIAAMGEWPVADVERALQHVQTFDPIGVAARDLQECLWLQIRHLGLEGTPTEKIVTEHLRLLQNHQVPEIARRLGMTIDDLKEHIEIIRNLDPKPGSRYNPQQSQYVIPDVYVVKVEDQYVAVLNEEGLPQLRISPTYRRLLDKNAGSNQANDETRAYVKDKFRSALWLIKSVDRRLKTIQKVANSIINFQREFLDHGIEYLRPLVLRDVANDIGMHESTVSRVVNNKYMHTPQGVFELKYFFHSGISSSYGDSVSSVTIKQRIRKIIENEDPRKPLSDSKIVSILQKEGLMLARRTIAKYREELKIPTSNQRKVLY
jgi:RNA polymerase sigma-54 factor